ncbi:hypothetical protein MRX96_018143 [Rhipicephalus microplus]
MTVYLPVPGILRCPYPCCAGCQARTSVSLRPSAWRSHMEQKHGVRPTRRLYRCVACDAQLNSLSARHDCPGPASNEPFPPRDGIARDTSTASDPWPDILWHGMRKRSPPLMYLFAHHGSLRRLPLVPLAQRPHHPPAQLLPVQLAEQHQNYRPEQPFLGLEDVVEASLPHRRHPRVPGRPPAVRQPVLRRRQAQRRLPCRATPPPLPAPALQRLGNRLRFPERHRPCHQILVPRPRLARFPPRPARHLVVTPVPAPRRLLRGLPRGCPRSLPTSLVPTTTTTHRPTSRWTNSVPAAGTVVDHRPLSTNSRSSSSPSLSERLEDTGADDADDGAHDTPVEAPTKEMPPDRTMLLAEQVRSDEAGPANEVEDCNIPRPKDAQNQATLADEGQTLNIFFPIPHSFTCPIDLCGYSGVSWTSRRQSLVRHLLDEHEIKVKVTYTCTLCSTTGLGLHSTRHPCFAREGHELSPLDFYRHKCPECPVTHTSRKGLDNHMRKHRRAQAQETTQQPMTTRTTSTAPAATPTGRPRRATASNRAPRTMTLRSSQSSNSSTSTGSSPSENSTTVSTTPDTPTPPEWALTPFSPPLGRPTGTP